METAQAEPQEDTAAEDPVAEATEPQADTSDTGGEGAETLQATIAMGDPAAGESLFRQCSACHMIGENASNRLGPALTGVVGRLAGSVEGFRYSSAMEAKGEEGMIWTGPVLRDYLEDPRSYVPGTRMAYNGLRDEQDRNDLVSYLATFSE